MSTPAPSEERQENIENPYAKYAHFDNDEDDEDPTTSGYQPTADELRTMANRFFAEGDFESALPLYTMAVQRCMTSSTNENDKDKDKEKEHDEEKDKGEQGNLEDDYDEAAAVVHLCNRSACYFKMEQFEEAKQDASDAFQLSKGTNAKAAFRLARAQMALQLHQDAISTIDTALASVTLSSNDDTEAEASTPNDSKEGEANQPSTTTSTTDNATNTTDTDTAKDNDQTKIKQQRAELLKLQTQAKRKLSLNPNAQQKPFNLDDVKSIRYEKRTPSIKEFIQGEELGIGNFSRVVACRHKVTGEEFALKIIDKKKAADLAKRQHPNVYNEIHMERRILGERLQPPHPLHIRMFHAFQDYNSLYFLNELQTTGGGEMWGKIMYRKKLCGYHPSLVRFYLAELVEILEHLHSHGIVHRDLKAENILLSATGHIVLIDFGTAKDLQQTDLNGPEFVGTPDFMSPEAVKATDQRVPDGEGADHSSDLWSLGIVAHQLFTGHPCFVTQSPYLTFLKIQRGLVLRPVGLKEDEDAWDFIKSLVQVDPNKRLGACVSVDEKTGKMVRKAGDLSALKNHPFFTRGTVVDESRGDVFANYGEEVRLNIGTLHKRKAMRVPSLKDLCIRACGALVRKDALDLDVPDPGDGSNHDLLRLSHADRAKIMQLLDNLNVLGEPRIFRRFFKSRLEAKLSRIRPETRDYVGLTQGDHGPKTVREDDSPEDIKIIHITNPLFVKERNLGCTDEAQRKAWIQKLKESIKTVNRLRPKFVVATGYIDEKCRKLLAKINETVPLILADGNSFYSFWVRGMSFLVLRGDGLVKYEAVSGEEPSSEVIKARRSQNLFLRQELEQIRMGQRKTMVFVDCDPQRLPKKLLRKFVLGGVWLVAGCCHTEEKNEDDEDASCQYELKEEDVSEGNEEGEPGDENTFEGDGDEDSETSSVASDSEKKTISLLSGRLNMITIEEFTNWKAENLLVS